MTYSPRHERSNLPYPSDEEKRTANDIASLHRHNKESSSNADGEKTPCRILTPKKSHNHKPRAASPRTPRAVSPKPTTPSKNLIEQVRGLHPIELAQRRLRALSPIRDTHGFSTSCPSPLRQSISVQDLMLEAEEAEEVRKET
jgi:hypothetical protein